VFEAPTPTSNRLVATSRAQPGPARSPMSSCPG
jgi:hypothetical protein